MRETLGLVRFLRTDADRTDGHPGEASPSSPTGTADTGVDAFFAPRLHRTGSILKRSTKEKGPPFTNRFADFGHILRSTLYRTGRNSVMRPCRNGSIRDMLRSGLSRAASFVLCPAMERKKGDQS